MASGPDRKNRKVSDSLSRKKEHQCIVNDSKCRVVLYPDTKEIKFGFGKARRFRDFSLTYTISDDRRSYNYSLTEGDDVLIKFKLSSEAHVPFKNDCSDLKISLSNVGPNVPPVSKRIEPLEPLTRISRPSLELAVKLIETSPTVEPDMVGKLVQLTINERGIYFTSSLFKFFRWNETKLTRKQDEAVARSTLVTISSSKMSVVIDALSEETFNKLYHELERRKRLSSPHEKGDEAPTLSSPLPDFADSTGLNKEDHSFKVIDPVQFYSPQARLPFGSREPVASSSPRQSNTNKIFSTPSQSVESIGKLSGCRLLEDSHASSKTSTQISADARPISMNSSGSQQVEFTIANISQETEAQTLDLSKSSEPPRPRRRRSTRTVIYEDEFDGQIDITESDFSQLRAEGFKPVLYKFWDGKSMKVAIEDIARLNPQIYINDTIIWFFLRLYMEKLGRSNPDAANDVLLLDTFYYFSMRNGETPPSWVLKIRIETKGIVVMPIHESSHWSLAIIVDLDKRLGGQPTPIKIVVLDSLGPSHVHHTARKVVTVLTKSLRSHDLDVTLLQKFQAVRTDIPTQTNSTDCGVYLLHYVAQIFANLETFREKLSATTERTLEMGAEFWNAGSMATKRSDLKQQLKDLGNVNEIVEKASEGEEGRTKRSESASSGSSSSRGCAQDDGEKISPTNGVEEEDAIEVIAMETLTHQKLRSGSALHSQPGSHYLGPPPGRPGRRSNAVDDIFKSPR